MVKLFQAKKPEPAEIPAISREQAQAVLDIYTRLDTLDGAIKMLKEPLSTDLANNYRYIVDGGLIPDSIMLPLLKEAITLALAAHTTEREQLQARLV